MKKRRNLKTFRLFPFILVLSINIFAQNKDQVALKDYLYPSIKKDWLQREAEIPKMFVTQKLNWADFETPLTKDEKYQYFNKIALNSFFYLEESYLSLEELHFIDFNSDNLTDIIYTGRMPGGSEIDNFTFFENQIDSLRLTFENVGTIIELRQENKNIPIEFTVWSWPCCDGQKHIIHYYKFYPNKDCRYSNNVDLARHGKINGKYISNFYSNFKPIESYLFVKSTFLSDSADLNGNSTFETINDSVVLESNPHLILKPIRESYIPEGYKLNIEVALIEKNTKGVIISKKTFNYKEYYLIMFSKENIISDLSFKNRPVYNLIAWVKSTDVMVIK